MKTFSKWIIGSIFSIIIIISGIMIYVAQASADAVNKTHILEKKVDTYMAETKIRNESILLSLRDIREEIRQLRIEQKSLYVNQHQDTKEMLQLISEIQKKKD
jgi:hypothetical protein